MGSSQNFFADMQSDSSVPLELFTDVTSPNVLVRASHFARARFTQHASLLETPFCNEYSMQVRLAAAEKLVSALKKSQVPFPPSSLLLIPLCPPPLSCLTRSHQDMHASTPLDVSASPMGVKPIGDGERLMRRPIFGHIVAHALCREARSRLVLCAQARHQGSRKQQVCFHANLTQVQFMERVLQGKRTPRLCSPAFCSARLHSRHQCVSRDGVHGGGTESAWRQRAAGVCDSAILCCFCEHMCVVAIVAHVWAGP